MLEIISALKPFFEDNYRRINIREYARMQKVSPPTASRILSSLCSRSILKREIDKRYIYYYADKDSGLFIDLSRIFWKIRLKKSGLLDYIAAEAINPLVILFGSLSKAEVKRDSDIDLAIFLSSNKEIVLTKFERKMKRIIHPLVFAGRENVKNEALLNNILNGYTLMGKW